MTNKMEPLTFIVFIGYSIGPANGRLSFGQLFFLSYIFMALQYDEILAGNCFGQINMTPPPRSNSLIVTEKKDEGNLFDQFGLSIEHLFTIARQFLKEKQGNKDLQLKYADNIRLIALSKQIKIGPWNASYTQDVGFLDVVGNDRKQAWISLGDMSREKAMEEYVHLLLDRCSIFRIYLENQPHENEEKDQLRKDEEIRRTLEKEAQRVSQYELAQVLRLEKKNKKREDYQRKQIQDVLNQQTYSQFKAYAEQQYRDNRQAQEELIRQLQEQHFQQYMEQVYQQQLLDQQLQTKSNMELQAENVIPTNVVLPTPASLNIVVPPILPNNIIAPPVPGVLLQSIPQIPPLGPAPAQLPPLVHPPPPGILLQSVINTNATIPETQVEPIVPIQTQFETLNLNSPSISDQFTSVNNEAGTAPQFTDGIQIAATAIDPNATANTNGEESLIPEEGKTEVPNLVPANMWTRKDVKEFKEQIRKEKDAVIKISSGETVTVRVPTHEDGQSIFWEFSTDYYDLGFGVYFEWSKAQSNTVTVHVSDSSEEEEDNGDPNNPEKKDIEKGSGSTNKPPKPRQDEVVPIYRRDCHEEVYAGSHPYPGHGVYLLKFDNSYSLWRSKTLYYRVYYSK